MICFEDARRIAQSTIPSDYALIEEATEQIDDLGWYFLWQTRMYIQTGKIEDGLAPGGNEMLADAETGEVFEFGSAFPTEYWIDAYRESLHKLCDVVVAEVTDRSAAVRLLARLQMSYVIPEEAYGTVWTVPQFYSSKQISAKLENLPARFESQDLIFRLEEYRAIRESSACHVSIEPHVGMESGSSGDVSGPGSH